MRIWTVSWASLEREYRASEMEDVNVIGERE